MTTIPEKCNPSDRTTPGYESHPRNRGCATQGTGRATTTTSFLLSCFMLLSIITHSSFTVAGENGNGTAAPNESDITIEWDFYSIEYRYIFEGPGNYEIADITMEIIDETNGTSETLSTDNDRLTEEGSRIIGVSSMEPVDDHNYTINVKESGDLIASRTILTTSKEYAYEDAQFEYLIEVHVTEDDENERITMDMYLIGQIDSSGSREIFSMSGDVSTTMESEEDDLTMFMEMSGSVEGMETEVSGEKTESFLMMDMVGTYTMESDDGVQMDGDVEMRGRDENDMKTDDYMKMDGDWSYMGDTGTMFMEEKTVRTDYQENFNGTVFSCLVQDGYSKTTVNGNTLENFTTSWEVREAGYDNETIFLEYEEKENGVRTEEGTDYPEDSPVPDEIDIMDVTDLYGVDPDDPVVGDVVIDRSETDVDFAVRYLVEGTEVKTIGETDFNCYRIEGEVIVGGSGTSNGFICYDSEYKGILIIAEDDYAWGDQTLKESFELNQYPDRKSGDDDDEVDWEIILPLSLVAILVIVFATYLAMRGRDSRDESDDWYGEGYEGTPGEVTPREGGRRGHGRVSGRVRPSKGAAAVHGRGTGPTKATTGYPCPNCGSTLHYVKEYGSYYCWTCEDYPYG